MCIGNGIEIEIIEKEKDALKMRIINILCQLYKVRMTFVIRRMEYASIQF